MIGLYFLDQVKPGKNLEFLLNGSVAKLNFVTRIADFERDKEGSKKSEACKPATRRKIFLGPLT